MIKRMKYVLNNENGGPNLEHLLGIAIMLVLSVPIASLSGYSGDLLKEALKKLGPMDDYFG